MDKNTIIAIVLSTLVIVVAFVLQPIIFPNTRNANYQATETVENTENINTSEELSNSILTVDNASGIEESEDNQEIIPEENFVVQTDLAKIVLTNKGGDIISYELITHQDLDTGRGIELSDNISDFNRTASLALGPVDSKIINDVFESKKIDDYTYLFTKKYVKDGKSFILGKRYTFMPKEYMFKLDVPIPSDEEINFDNDGVFYTIRTSPQIGPHYDPKKNRYESRQFVAFGGNKYKRTNLATNQFKRYDKEFIWSGIAGKYFVELIVPEKSDIINSGFYSTQIEVNDYSNAQALIERKAFKGNDITDTYYFYFGPRNNKDLKRYNVAEENGWGFGGRKLTECIQTSGLLNWLEVALKYILELINKVVHNWGASIIIMTIILKAALFPLSKKQSMGTLKMQEIQPKIQAIQEKYKNDQQKLQIETQKLYKEAGYNPASGCLPMILQMLILISMFNLFNNYFEFRGAMFIPKWIPDLSTGDSVATLKFNLPLIGNQIRILPIIYVVVQILNGIVTQFGGMTSSNGGNNASMKFMTYGLPLLFFFMFYNAPAGLLLYWTVSSIFQIGQQMIINKIMKDKKAEMNFGKKDENRVLPPKAKKASKNKTSNGKKLNKKL